MHDIANVRTRPAGLLACLEEICREANESSKVPRIVSDIMTKQVQVLTLDHSVKACLEFMEFHRVRHAPVLDYPNGKRTEPEFIGVVSQRDVLRVGTRASGRSLPRKPDPRALKRLLTRVVTRDARVVAPDTPIDEAVGILINFHIDMLPVLERGRVAGIVTTTDFALMLINVVERIERAHRHQTKQTECSAWLAGACSERVRLARYARKTVVQIMAPDVVTLTEDQNLSHAIDVIQEHQLRHLPVVDQHGKLAGILSDRDILRNLPYAAMPPLKSPSSFRDVLFADDGSGAAAKVPVAEAMTAKVLTTTPDDLLVDAARLLKRKGFGALPVVDTAGSLVGIVTMLDILQAVRDLY